MNNSLPPQRPLEPRPRVILIGASSGIGAALVRQLVRENYVVAAVARRLPELQTLCDSVNAAKATAETTWAIPYQHDVTHYDDIPALFQQIVRDLGGLDLIIYNAGVMANLEPHQYDFAQDKQQIEVNTLGAMAWLNQAAIRFQQTGAGQIVGISSVAGDRGRQANPGYNTSKAALSTYLEALRNRLSRHGVTVTTIKPGFVQTQMLENAAKTFWVITPDDAAVQIIHAAQKGKQTAYIPWRWGLVMLIIRHIPSFIFRRLSI